MPPATKLLPPRGSSRPLPPRVVAPHHTAPAQSTVRGDLPSTARKAVTCDSCHPEEEKEEEEEDEVRRRRKAVTRDTGTPTRNVTSSSVPSAAALRPQRRWARPARQAGPARGCQVLGSRHGMARGLRTARHWHNTTFAATFSASLKPGPPFS
ncbi:unnamed protein product [Prorocentrum cordatum]|uniref:Uncharacterized protein n=1 Tax=Prorocentrum cordatum TaxID=2364126 RepID=A0ABN9UPB5_9DINO|nr:unnamed protein product [Polarella glacialis]